MKQSEDKPNLTNEGSVDGKLTTETSHEYLPLPLFICKIGGKIESGFIYWLKGLFRKTD